MNRIRHNFFLNKAHTYENIENNTAEIKNISNVISH